MDLDLELQMQYEHIDWNDIVDAELSGDQDTLEVLRNKSLELKRSFSLPSPIHSPPPSKVSSPPSHGFHPPRRSRRPLGPKSLNHQRSNGQIKNTHRYQRSHSLQTQSTLNDLDNSFPSLLKHSAADESVDLRTSPTTPKDLSYAQATGRVSKRTASDRSCVSPTVEPSKRSAVYGVVVTPTALKPNSLRAEVGGGQSSDGEDREVQCTPGSESIDEYLDNMDTTTPENNSRPVKSGAAQRRLFSFSTPDRSSTPQQSEIEKLSDPHRLTKRQKQIDIGKNTIGYETYIQTIPRWKRQRGDPATPDKYDPCSTRSWQGRIKVWRRALHEWDPPSALASLAAGDTFTTEDASLCNLDLDSGEQLPVPTA